ncbi:MAG: hypothetical protein RL357_455 [Pseudomonadota bacterium]
MMKSGFPIIRNSGFDVYDNERIIVFVASQIEQHSGIYLTP